jgi:hypothetical protein
MQRAAASKEAKEAKEAESTGDSSQPTPKRRRVSTEAESPRNSEMEAISAALAAEEEKRQEAIARQAAESGETQWVLDIPAASQYTPQPVVLAADSLDDGSQGGRRGYGNFKRKEREVGLTVPYVPDLSLTFLCRRQLKNKSRRNLKPASRRRTNLIRTRI